MPTQIYQLTTAPVNLIGANDIDGNPLSLAVGSRYQGRFVALDPQGVLKVLEIADGTAVPASATALPVRTYEDLIIVPAGWPGHLRMERIIRPPGHQRRGLASAQQYKGSVPCCQRCHSFTAGSRPLTPAGPRRHPSRSGVSPSPGRFGLVLGDLHGTDRARR